MKNALQLPRLPNAIMFVFCQFLLHLSCRTRAAILFFPNAFSSKDSLAHQSHLHNPCPYRAAQERRAPQITSVSKLSDTGSRTLLVMSLCVNQYVNEHIKVCPTCPVHKDRVTWRLTCCLVYAVPRNIPWEASNIFLMMKAAEANSAESPPASKDRCSADSYLNRNKSSLTRKNFKLFSVFLRLKIWKVEAVYAINIKMDEADWKERISSSLDNVQDDKMGDFCFSKNVDVYYGMNTKIWECKDNSCKAENTDCTVDHTQCPSVSLKHLQRICAVTSFIAQHL